MEKKIKVFVVGGSTYYVNFINNHELVKNIEDADVVLFTGGEDVNPSLYGCQAHSTTHYNAGRDSAEKKVFNSIKPNQLAVGICRGSQFLCVMNGGKLIQDCDRHARYGTHEITNGNVAYQITSTHHQMQYPFDLPKNEYKILYWANAISSYYAGDKIDVHSINVEPEVVLYTKPGNPRCLAIQGHPEIMRITEPVVKMLNELIESQLVQINLEEEKNND